MKEAAEIVIKTMSDYWVVGKLSNLREFFVVIQQKNANIIDIEGECNIRERSCELASFTPRARK